jgi:hypothetical protein
MDCECDTSTRTPCNKSSQSIISIMSQYACMVACTCDDNLIAIGLKLYLFAFVHSRRHMHALHHRMILSGFDTNSSTIYMFLMLSRGEEHW